PALGSVHVAETGPEIIVARDEGEGGREPKANEAQEVDPRLPGQGSAENQGAERDQLEGGLPFGEPADGNRNPEFGEEFAKARDDNLAQHDDNRRNDVEILNDRGVAVRPPARHQHDDDGRDHDLVGDRVEELPELGDLPLRAREITVEIIRDADDAVQEEGDRIIPGRGLPQQKDEDRHREDARERQQVGQRQHRSWTGVVIEFGLIRKAGYAFGPISMASGALLP